MSNTSLVLVGTVEAAPLPYWSSGCLTAIVDDESRWAVDAAGNLCFWWRDRYLLQGGETWESPYYWQACKHIEAETPLPDGLAWLRCRYLYTGSDYTREEWENKPPSYCYVVARRAWLEAQRRNPVCSKVWTFDDDPPFTPYYPWYPPQAQQLGLFAAQGAQR